MVRTTKHASCSSTDQGGGKRRAGILVFPRETRYCRPKDIAE